MESKSLFRDRRFWPIFFTQLLGAFNDNFFKNALVILITYQSASLWGLSPEQLVVLCGGIFILPFFLFSATAGQLADKLEKSHLIIAVKIFEILIMAAAAFGFIEHHISFLLLALLMMGFHSTIFGPVKYSYLPQLMTGEADLISANALFQMGTFIAILVGTIAGGLSIAHKPHGESLTGAIAIAIAGIGFLFSLYVKPTLQREKNLKVEWNPVTPTLRVFRETLRHRDIFLSILGISWFWFFGAAMLSLFPAFGKNVLHGDEHVVTFFLALFSVGIGLGSILCKRLSGEKLELGLVPFGSIGLSLFTLDLFFASPGKILGPGAGQIFELISLGKFLSNFSGWRITFDLFCLSVAGGLYIVPLMTLIQQRSDKSMLSRIIASNNILNSLAMVLASLLLMALLGFGLQIGAIFAVLGVLNFFVAYYIFRVMPEFTLRFAAWLMATCTHTMQVQHAEYIPEHGPAVLICNHTSYIDWLFIQAASRRPIRFVMDHTFLKLPFVGFIFRDMKVIPIAQAKENATLKEQAFRKVREELSAGNLVCIFPEGFLTRDGNLSPFRPGIDRVLAEFPCPVVPIAIYGLWDSAFSKNPQTSPLTFLQYWRKRVDLVFGPPIPAAEASSQQLQEKVQSMLSAIRSKST